MSDELVILRSTGGADEVNARGKSFRVNRFGCVRVPEEDTAPLLLLRGFHRAKPTDPSSIYAELSDVAEVCWHLKPGKLRDTLLAITRSPNSASHLVQCISLS
jgi:hypothetical protein